MSELELIIITFYSTEYIKEELEMSGKNPVEKSSSNSSVFKNRSFVFLLCANFITRFGDSLDAIALSWIVYKITGSEILMGSIFALSFVPTLILSPVAGVISDKVSKKKLASITDLCRGLVMVVTGVLYFSGSLAVWHIVIMVLLNSTFEAFSMPARSCILPYVLKEDEFVEGSGVSTTASSLGELLGLAIAGVIIGFLGASGAIIIDAATFFISGILISLLSFEEEIKGLEKFNAKEYISDFSEALKLIKGTKSLMYTIILIGLVNFFITPMNVFSPIFSDRYMGIGSYGMVIIGIGVTSGAALGGLLVGRISKKLSDRAMVSLGLSTLGLAYSLIGLIPTLSANKTLISVSIFILSLCIGSSSPIAVAPLKKIIMTQVDRSAMGRVMSVLSMISLSAMPFGGFLSGALGNVMEITYLFMIFGVAIIIVSNIMVRAGFSVSNVENIQSADSGI